MTNNEYQAIRNKALTLKKQKKGFIAYLQSVFKCSKTQAKDIFCKLTTNQPLAQVNPAHKDAVIKGDGYVYNQLNDKYIVPLTTYGGDFVCPGDQHRAMLAAYSNWQGGEKSIATISRLYKMRREWVVEYFKIFKFTHDTVPITTEEIVLKKEKEAIDRVLQTRRTELQQELEHADWKETQKDAENWRLFEAGKLDPFSRVIEKYNPRPFTPVIYKGSNKTRNEKLLIGLSDLHFGGRANSDELYSGEDFDSEKIQNIMNSYFTQLSAEVDNRKNTFNEVVVCSVGDILHGLSGFTVKGTPLESDLLREEQFELALNSLVNYFRQLLTIFKKVTVYAVKGNHAGVGDYILFKTIQIYFRNDPRISFNLFKSRQGCFRIGNTAILMDHGASDFAKSIMPTSGAPKEAYVQALFMEHPEILQGAKSKLMLTGDRHRFLQEEMRGFEHVTFGSCVSGDRYADNLGLHSRPRQNCLVLTDDGIKEALSFYFD